LAITAKSYMKIHLMNAQNAYLGCELDKEILMEVSEGVDCPEGHVLLVLQSLYRLKQLVNL